MEESVKLFSLLEKNMQKLEAEADWKKLNTKNDAWSKELSTKEQVAERIAKSDKDFWAFDSYYYTPDMYSNGYSEPSAFHKHIATLPFRPGINILLGPRKMAKTATVKKVFPWLILTGKLSFLATGSSVLTTSSNILTDIVDLLDNEKMLFDYKHEILEANQNQATIYIPGIKKTARIIAISEGVSARGKTKLFDRPEMIFFDDLETRQSALGDEQVQARIKIIQETKQSMSETGSLIVVGNNFDERCALNQLLLQQNEKQLPPDWRVEVFKAWENGKSIWESRYPAKSEDEMRLMCKVADEAEWLGDFQQEPAKPDGFIFKRLAPTPKWTELPDDARGVLWCDPNLSLKGKGDKTAILSMLYSPSTEKFYVSDIICRSYSDSDKLLDDYLHKKTNRIRYCGFDGNVAQESTWTNNIRNWCRIHQTLFPTIFYRRYKVDELSKNAQMAWISGKILLPDGIENSEDGNVFLKQLYAFRGKSFNKKDDGPDALISAFELIHESKLGGRTVHNAISRITDFFNF